MIQQPSRLQNILISQIAIVLLSLVSTFFPQYFLLAIILYTIILFSVMSYTTTRKTKPRPEELKNPIFRENDSMKIAMYDKELSKELTKQMKTMMLGFITLPLAFIVFPLYMAYLRPLVGDILSKYFSDEIARFLNFVIMYETVFAILSTVRSLVMKKASTLNIMLPKQYIVYRTGVLMNNRMFIRFSGDLCYNYNPKRKFIELVNINNPNTKIRLYSENISKLKDRLSNLENISECET